MRQFTLPQLFNDGLCFGDIDAIVREKLATLANKNGRTVLNIPNYNAVHDFLNWYYDKH